MPTLQSAPSFRQFTTRHPEFTRHPGNSPVIPAIHHPSFRQFTTRHSGESRNLAPPGNCPAPPVIPAIHHPSSRRFTRHSGESRNLAPPGNSPPVIPAIHHPSSRQFTTRHSGESRNLAPPGNSPPVIPAIHHPSSRRFTRHPGESRNLAPPGNSPSVIPAIHHPSFRRKPESSAARQFTTRHPGDSPPVIPAIHHPSFRRKPESSAARQLTTRHPGNAPTRHPGESRNLAPPLHSTFPRSNGFSPQPPEKSAIFSDATHLRSAHKCGTLAISKSGNPAQKGRRPPKSQPGRPSTRRPVGLKSNQAKSIGRNNGQPSRNRVQDNTAKTVGIATIVGSGTHSASFTGGVSGHAAGVPTALCRPV